MIFLLFLARAPSLLGDVAAEGLKRLLAEVVLYFAGVLARRFFADTETTYGRRIYAVGGNPKAATLVGIKPKAVKISAYVICAITAAIGGIMLASQNLNATYITGKGYEGPVMMVIVVGGISLMGGEGGIGGVLFGALLVGILNNMIILLGISTDYTDFVQGVVIILAVALNVYSSRKSMGLVKPHVSRKKRLAQAAESAEKQ